jgi:hypothetical protein
MVLVVHLLSGGPSRLRIHVSHCLKWSQIFCLPPFVLFKTRPETLIGIRHTSLLALSPGSVSHSFPSESCLYLMVTFGQPLLSVLLSLELDDYSVPDPEVLRSAFFPIILALGKVLRTRCAFLFILVRISLWPFPAEYLGDAAAPCPTYQAHHDAQYVNTFVLHTANRASTRGDRPVATINVVCFTCCCCRPPRTVIVWHCDAAFQMFRRYFVLSSRTGSVLN